MNEQFVRNERNKAIVNTDVEAYTAAKLARQKVGMLERLNKRVALLEKNYADLQSRLEKMEQK